MVEGSNSRYLLPSIPCSCCGEQGRREWAGDIGEAGRENLRFWKAVRLRRHFGENRVPDKQDQW